MDNVIANKANVIDRCIARVQEEFVSAEQLKENQTQQDAIVLNLLRACEAAIDIGNRVIRQHRFEPPQDSRGVFVVIEKQRVIDSDTSKKMQKMVGFRNIAVHDYQAISFDIIVAVVEHHLGDFEEFVSQVFRFAEK